MKKIFAFLAIAFLTSCSSEGRYQMDTVYNHEIDREVIYLVDTKSGVLYEKFDNEWIKFESPKVNSTPIDEM